LFELGGFVLRWLVNGFGKREGENESAKKK